ncbi:hypothetical protein GRJ2_000834000 [Grus japonensis]|uniref:Secreted protein n=1 Tax=Grus japonensis TaxID=30415 RepID=A0ABC9WG88_GRUJA
MQLKLLLLVCGFRSAVGSRRWFESYPFIPDHQQFFAGARTKKVKNWRKKSHKPISSSFFLCYLLVRAWLGPWIIADPYSY